MSIGFDILPCLRLCQLVRYTGVPVGYTRTRNPEWVSDTTLPRTFSRHGWLMDYYGFLFGFETLDYRLVSDSAYRTGFYRVNTVDERVYELIGDRWVLRFEFHLTHYGANAEQSISFFHLWGLPCGVRLLGDLDAFQHQMTLVRLGTNLDTMGRCERRDHTTGEQTTIGRYEVELRP